MKQSKSRIARENTAILYERLSRDDNLEGDSYSIQNQKKLLTKIAKEKGYTHLLHFYDDGISGVTMERPGFQAMLAQIEQDQLEGLDALMGAILPSMDSQAPPEALLTLFVYLNEHEALCGALMGQNGDAAFVRRICDLLEKRVIGHFVEPGQETPRQRYLTSFAVNGCVGSIEAWLQNGRTQSPEEMSAMTWDAVRAIWAAASGASE